MLHGVDGTDGATGPQGVAGTDGQNGTNGSDGLNGLSCWDLNGDDIAEANEDVNGDGYWDTLDCQGTSNGVLFLSPNSTEPFTCDTASDGAVALNSFYTLCVCNSTGWVLTVDGSTSCDWGVPTVTSFTGRIWMDRNLGASRVATSIDDAAAYGDLYQWGRGTDGHQLRTSATTTTLSSSDAPGHGDYILAPSSPMDWRSPHNDNLWQGVSGINNPCPAGFRLPTDIEMDTERASWTSNNAAGAFASPLKLVPAGYRDISNGTLNYVDSYGYYWSSSVNGSYAFDLTFGIGSGSSSNVSSGRRAYGCSVRCLKD